MASEQPQDLPVAGGGSPATGTDPAAGGHLPACPQPGPAHSRKRNPLRGQILGTYKPPPAPAVGVCGFGRCGSTMAMSMLVAGGCPPVDDATDPPYELANARLAHHLPLAGRCVKLLDSATYCGLPRPPAGGWRFVWLDRDPVQQAISLLKMLTGFGNVSADQVASDAVDRLVASFARDRPRLLGMLRQAGPVLVLDYETVLAQPRKTAKLLRREVWPALDVDAAAAVVHRRDGTCRPDLSVEAALTGTALRARRTVGDG